LSHIQRCWVRRQQCLPYWKLPFANALIQEDGNGNERNKRGALSAVS
jgi:hypothetical protein